MNKIRPSARELFILDQIVLAAREERAIEKSVDALKSFLEEDKNAPKDYTHENL